MDYKKIIAATAVTSAAFVVPAVVDAATEANPKIIAVPTTGFELGQVITAPEDYKFTTDADTKKITKYEWVAEYIDGTQTSISKTKSVTVPVNSNLKKIILKFYVGETEYFQEVTINTSKTIEFHEFPILEPPNPVAVTNGLVNQPIQAKIPDDKKVVKYEWYIVNGGTSRLLSGEEDQIIDIPVAASGKKLLVVAIDSEDKKYYGELAVEQLKLDDFSDTYKPDLKLNGNAIPTDTKSIAPGDMLSVENLEIKAHGGNVEILQSQAIVTYQWYYSDPATSPKTLSVIPGATGPMYLVPDDAFGRNLKNISVAITIEVPDSDIDSETQYLHVMELTNEAATELEDKIKVDLGNASKYDILKFPMLEDFSDKMKAFEVTYDALSTGSKALVPSYPKVTQALQDIKTVQALIKDLDAFTIEKSKFDANSTELAHSKLLKQFEAIEKKYQKFDSLKRSLLEMDTTYKNNYIEVMSQHLKNLTQDAGNEDYKKSSLEFIGEINSKIQDLFDQNDEGSHIYTFDKLDEDIVPQTRAGMAQQIKLLEAEIKQVDRQQQPVINSSLLKTAKSDLKKADTVGEKIAAITTATPDKKIKATLSARTAFDKLSFMQQSLIELDEYDLIYGTDAYSEKTAIDNISEAIAQLVNGTSYVFDGYTGDLIGDATSLPNAVDVLLAQYKTLNSKAKKSVTNYAVLTQAKKDLAAATKVIKAITNAYEFHSAVPADEIDKKMKSIQSKYRSAYNAYVKLTPLQRTIVEELTEDNVKLTDLADELEVLTDDVFTPDPESELAYDPSGVVGSLADLEALISGGARTVQEVEDKIKEITAAYKELNAAEKKGVYNYSILAQAKTVAKKAASVQTTLTNALNSGSEARMISAVNAYNKLSDAQKNMISDAYGDVETALQSEGKDKLKEDLELFDLETFTFTLETLEAIQLNLALVDKKEYQNFPGYQNYLQALKIQKAVDSFLKKFNKLDPEPTYSKKQSILKDFKKLTQQQLKYFNASYEDIYTLIKEWDTGLNTTANILNDEIGILVVVDGTGYTYKKIVNETPSEIKGKKILEEIEEVIADIKTRYKALDAKERKLVTHYSFLTKIERDIKAVRKAIDVSATANAQTSQQTYNRLTNQQQYLYDLVVAPTTP